MEGRLEIHLVGLPGNPTYSSIDALLAAAAVWGLTHTGADTESRVNLTLRGLPKFK